MDTAGQDEYSIFPTQYTMDIHGYVLVYSITSSKSFDVVKIIYDKLLDVTGKIQYEKLRQYFLRLNYFHFCCNLDFAFSVPIVLVGNKKDLHMERSISTEQGKMLADSWKVSFLEASAKQNDAVNEIFHSILTEIERANGNVQEKSNCSIS